MDIATIVIIILLFHGHTAISGDSVAVVTGGSLSSPGQLTSAAQLSVVCAEASPASTGLYGSSELVPKARKALQHLEAPSRPTISSPQGPLLSREAQASGFP